jgi:chromosome segregation ATPase
MDYLTTHGPGCQCRPTDRRYPTLCELVTALRAELAAALRMALDAKDAEIASWVEEVQRWYDKLQAADTEIARLTAEVERLGRLPERCASCDNDEHYLEMQRANRTEAALAAERQQVRAFRAWHEGWIAMLSRPEARSADNVAKRHVHLSAVEKLDALGLTGEEPR